MSGGQRSSSQRNDQRDYVNQPISSGGSSSGFHHHHHHHHSSSASGQQQQSSGGHSGSNQQRARRTQKRVTHNEKRYHSGLYRKPSPHSIPPHPPSR